MEQVLDEGLLETEKTEVKYSGVWERFAALLVDALVLAPVTFGLNYLNITSWKSSLILVFATLLSAAYKPYMEYTYGATLGKMALKLKVVNLTFEQPTLGEILLRNVFHITPSLISLFFMISIYQLPEFESVSGYGDYTGLVSSVSVLQYVNIVVGLVTLADVIVFFADKHNRAWHDKIGGTCVIERR